MKHKRFNHAASRTGSRAGMSQATLRTRAKLPRRVGMPKCGLLPIMCVTALSVLGAFGTALAQSPNGPATQDDPVERAIKQAEDSASARADAAVKVITALRLVQQAKSARDRGESDDALRSLKQASSLLDAPALSDSLLAKSYLLTISEEARLLEPVQRKTPVWVSVEEPHVSVLPRRTLARLGSGSDNLASILKDEGLPPELLAVAIVESRLNRFALSPKGARGIWQFMPATARRYGLSVLPGLDDRVLPEQSTRAAARYLRDLYSEFGDWPLALAAYNAGEGRVRRAIEISGTASFTELARRRLLPLETRDYVPAVLKTWASLRWLATDSTPAPARAERRSL